MAGGSLFHVDDNVELWRVLAYLNLLVACVILLEQVLHLLKHKLAKYPKYHDMMNKSSWCSGSWVVLKLFKEFSHAPVSLLINMVFFQSRILRSFVLVSCIVRVDDAALGDMIDHFTDTVELRAEFVTIVTSFMEARQLTIADMETEFEANDAEKTGLLVEAARLVLQHFGFTLSCFHFNSVVKLLFTLHSTQVEYAQVEKLLTFAKQHISIRRLYDETSRMRGHEEAGSSLATE